MSNTLKPRTASVVIYQGDDMDRLTELRRTAEMARRAAEATVGAPKRLGDESPNEDADEAEAAYDAFVDEAAGRALTIEMHSIGRRRFRDLMAAHPPRKVTVTDEPNPDEPDAPVKEREVDHEDDAAYGVNTETFPDALLTFVDQDDPKVRTIVAPKKAGKKAIQDFLDDELAEGDFDSLWVTAYYLNRMPSQDPKASRYSVAPRSSTET